MKKLATLVFVLRARDICAVLEANNIVDDVPTPACQPIIERACQQVGGL